MSADNERNDAVVVRADCLDREEEVGTVLTLEVVDGCITNQVPMATPGAQLKALSNV